MTAIPGLIDSHVHITFGDYTPRQRTVGFLESYLHGGITTSISASEVHVPGRPNDPEGVKALALAAQRCFATYRPGGMRVIAGSVILEPGLTAADFKELAAKGVTLAKAGFGAVKTAYDYVPLVTDAKAAGLITTCHTGGSSIPGSGAITGDHLLAMHPHVSFHINGGPTAMPDADFERVIKESESRCRSAPPEICAPCCCARGLPTSSAPSTASSWARIRRPARASCRSGFSTPSPIALV